MGKNMNQQTLQQWYIIHKGLHLLNICTIYQPVVNNSFNYCIILQSIVDCVSFLDTQQQSYAMAKNLMRRLYIHIYIYIFKVLLCLVLIS